ncbi:MAG: hypothetical protein SGI86_18910 [Deltaproteobacteria bacterium]|nr:hypothetical protein [Deltaproteobacteria bacterium]
MLKMAWAALASLTDRREHFHLSFAFGRKFRLELWDRPGLWCDDDRLVALTNDMRAVAAAGQEGKDVPVYGALTGTREVLRSRVLTLVYDRTSGLPVGFNAMAYLDVRVGLLRETVLHLGLTFVDPQYQRQGLPALLYGVAVFVVLFRRGIRGYWISSVTQVPAVVGLVADGYRNVYPHYDRSLTQTFAHLLLARAIMKEHRAAFGVGDEAGFDESRQVITNAYTGGSDELKKTFADAPKHRKNEVNSYCEKALDYGRGDDVLQIGRCTFGSMLQFLGGKLPRGSAFQLAYRAVMLLLVSSVIPILRWLLARPEDYERDEHRV